MILFFAPGGRIGNLLFQLAFIESIRKPGEWLLATQLKGIHRHFCGIRKVLSTDNKLFVNIVDYIIYPLVFNLFVKTKVISSYMENGSGEVVYQKGVLPITLVGGYFQDGGRAQNGVQKIFPHQKYYVKPNEYLRKMSGKNPVFIHVRRTDYHDFTLKKSGNVVLPFSYYNDALKQFFNSIESFHFMIVGDDPEWAEQNFEFLQNKTVSRLSPLEDLALMSLCEGGIVSNSTFAWWGAHLSKKSLPIVAPKYWLGWKIGEWHPKYIQTNNFEYLEVKT